jgi:hypothetical protein
MNRSDLQERISQRWNKTPGNVKIIVVLVVALIVTLCLGMTLGAGAVATQQIAQDTQKSQVTRAAAIAQTRQPDPPTNPDLLP